MRAKTQAMETNFAARIKEAALAQGGPVENVLYAAVAFMMANSFLFGSMAPFGVAFAAASGRRNTIAGVAGAILGYTFSYNPISNMKYIIAVVVLAAAKWIVLDSRLARWETLATPLLSMLSMFAASISIAALDGLSPYDIVLVCSEAALAGGSTFFMMRTLQLVQSRDSWTVLSSAEFSCLIITFAIAMMALGSFTIAGLSVGRVIAVVVILLSARYGREAAGAVSGVTAGAAMGLLGSSFTFLAAAYGFGGLVAGMFSAFGSFGIAVVFVVVNGVVSLILGGEGMVMTSLYEVFAASVLFILIPTRWTDQLLAHRSKTAAITRTAKEVMLGKLRHASGALTDISVTTRQVSEKLTNLQESDISSVYTRGSQAVCAGCAQRAGCWGEAFGESMDSLNHLSGVLRRKGRATAQDLSGRLAQSCHSKEQLVQAVNAEYALEVQRRGSRRKSTEIRGVVTDQFEGMSMMLGALAQELSEIYEVDDRKSRGIADIFLRHKAELTTACSYEDKYGRLTIEAVLPAFKLARLALPEVTAELCDMCETTFTMPVLQQTGNTATLTFTEQAQLVAEYGRAQVPFGGGKLCGDCGDYFQDNRGRAHMLLSDGMGSGGKAAIDAAMTVSLLAKLLAAGFDYGAALKMVNSALLVKSEEESLSTIDLVTVDLYTGRADFLKAGAAPTYVLRSGAVGKVESMSMPAGILRGVSFEQSSMTLRAGDIVVMVSDGALLSGAEWLVPQIKLSKELPAQRMAQEIAEVASTRRADGHDDDITVCVLKLSACE